MYLVAYWGDVPLFLKSKKFIFKTGFYSILLWNTKIQNLFYYNNDDFTFSISIVYASYLKVKILIAEQSTDCIYIDPIIIFLDYPIYKNLILCIDDIDYFKVGE